MEGLMNDKIVTHEDLDAARALVEATDRHGTEASRELARSILAAAEADQPPLPEGWVLYRVADDTHRVLWHERGSLFIHDGCCELFDGADSVPRDRLTPLRPTVTEADVGKAARALAITNEGDDHAWELAVTAERADYRRLVRAAFRAAEIEVSDVSDG